MVVKNLFLILMQNEEFLIHLLNLSFLVFLFLISLLKQNTLFL